MLLWWCTYSISVYDLKEKTLKKFNNIVRTLLLTNTNN